MESVVPKLADPKPADLAPVDATLPPSTAPTTPLDRLCSGTSWPRRSACSTSAATPCCVWTKASTSSSAIAEPNSCSDATAVLLKGLPGDCCSPRAAAVSCATPCDKSTTATSQAASRCATAPCRAAAGTVANSRSKAACHGSGWDRCGAIHYCFVTSARGSSTRPDYAIWPCTTVSRSYPTAPCCWTVYTTPSVATIAAPRHSRCCSWTSTGSRPSTTASDIASVMRCCVLAHCDCAGRCATAIPRHVSAATSLPSSWRMSMVWTTCSRPLNASTTVCARSPSCTNGPRSSCAPASASRSTPSAARSPRSCWPAPTTPCMRSSAAVDRHTADAIDDTYGEWTTMLDLEPSPPATAARPQRRTPSAPAPPLPLEPLALFGTANPVTALLALREERIRVCAYFKAERRGFAPGQALQDWLAAEQEIDDAFRPL